MLNWLSSVCTKLLLQHLYMSFMCEMYSVKYGLYQHVFHYFFFADKVFSHALYVHFCNGMLQTACILLTRYRCTYLVFTVGVCGRMATRRYISQLRKVTQTWLSCCCSEEPMSTVSLRTCSLQCILLLKRTRSLLLRFLSVTSRKLTHKQR